MTTTKAKDRQDPVRRLSELAIARSTICSAARPSAMLVRIPVVASKAMTDPKASHP